MKSLLQNGSNTEESRFKAIFNAEPECVKVLDRSGRILQMNPAGLELFEAKTSEEVVGRPIFDFVAPPQTKEVRNCFSQAIERGSVTCVFEVIGLHGARRWMESHMVAMQINGDPLEVLAVARDMTKEKLAEQALRTSEERFRLIVENSNGIAHDFNNILAASIGYAELARLSVPTDSPAFAALNESLKASRRATDLVRQILTFNSQQERERVVITKD